MHEFQEATKVFDTENPTETNNFESVRRIPLGGDTKHTIRKTSLDTIPSQSDKPDSITSENLENLEKQIPAHLKEMYTEAVKTHDNKIKSELAKILIDHSNTFSVDESDIGITHLVEHVIDTGDCKPIRHAPRKVPLAFRGHDKIAIDKALNRGAIRESNSPWSAPIVLVWKKDGTVRMAQDYRELNKNTVKDSYPLPRISDCLDTVAGAKVFSSFDVTAAFNQVPVRECDIEKTAFCTKYGLFEAKYMPFGLSNSTATFERLMELVLRGLQWQTCLIFVYDILVFAETPEENLSRINEVLARVQEAGLKLCPWKSQLLQLEVLFLGHLISGEGVRPSPTTITKVLNWPTPTNIKQCRGFLALASYYRRHVKNFSEISKPMTELTSPKIPFVWNDAAQVAFDELKIALTGADVMAYPLADNSDFILDTDASAFALGAVLSQVQDGTEKVVAYASRTLNRAERNYCVTQLECLAIKYFVQYFDQYLTGVHFTVRTDHAALQFLFSMKEPRSRIARWIEILMGYDFTVEYRPGKRHLNADALSRCEDVKNCECEGLDDEEAHNLRCGPCPQCIKMAKNMESEWFAKNGTERVGRVATKRAKSNQGVCTVIWMMLLACVQFLRFSASKLKASVMGPIILLAMKFGKLPNEPVANNQVRIGRVKAPLFWPDDGRQRPKEKSNPNNIPLKTAESTELPKIAWCRHVATRGTSAEVTPWFQGHSNLELSIMQNEDGDISLVKNWMRAGKRPPSGDVVQHSPAVRHMWLDWPLLKMEDDILVRSYTKHDGTGKYLQFVVPEKLRQCILHSVHDTMLSGHLGRKKTTNRLLQNFYWYQCREDVRLWVMTCDTCQQVKRPPCHPRAPLGKMIVGGVMDRLAIDCLGPFPETKRRNSRILVVTDSFSKWVECLPIPDEKATTCARVLLNEIFSRFGLPLDLHCDNASGFQSEIMHELCRLLEVRRTHTSVKNPKANGQTERFNHTLLNMIKSFTKGNPTDWDLWLGCFCGAYRSTPHETTSVSPNLAMLGREVRTPYQQGCLKK